MIRFFPPFALTVAAMLLAPTLAVAQPVVDGTLDAVFGNPLAVQTVQTQFGDNASELNAGYANVSGGRLSIALTGNIENNFNKLNVFIDAGTGGQNVIDGANNPTNDNWAAAHDGFTFDSGFQATHMLIFRRGAGKFDVDFAKVGGGAGDFDFFEDAFGGTDAGAVTGLAGTQISNLDVAYDDANTAGITGGTEAADPAAAEAVTTGLEFALDLADLGNPTGAIKVSAMVNGSNHDFLSNQILGGFQPPQGNLGSDGEGNFVDGLGVGGVNLNDFAGDQFFTIDIPDSVLPGDLDGNGVVDGLDIDPFVQVLTGSADFNAAADLDGNGTVDGLDIDPFVQALTGGGDAAISAVPEPTTAGLLAGAFGLMLARRRRMQ